MFDETLLQKLKERHPDIHPLIFHRSVEKASSAGELFDILDLFPHDYPVIWNESERRWKVTKDLFQINNFFGLGMEKKND